MHAWMLQDEKFGKVCSWQKKEGQKVSQGETLCEVEFTNFSINLTMEEDSYVAQILVPAGDSQTPVGAPLCVMVEKEVRAWHLPL
jgi:pyruvate dehydrogenase E2 component (dihydrolipoamide acetyltransferase)